MFQTKSILKSRKVLYSLATLIVSLVVVALPMISDDWTPAQLEMIKKLLPGVIVVGLALIGGHTLTDITSMWTNKPQYQNLGEAVKQAVQILATEVDPNSEFAKQLKKLFDDAGVDLS